MKLKHFSGVIVITACLCSCKPVESYSLPQNVALQDTATVVGSRIEKSALTKDIRTRVSRIDDKPAPVRDPTQPFQVAPGVHRVLLYVSQGDDYSATWVQFNFEPGRNYVVRAANPFTENAQLWLEDRATGEVAGEKFHATTGRAYDPALPFALIPAGGKR